MTTATKPREAAPATAADPTAQAAERLSHAAQRLEQLRTDARQCSAALDAALDAGDRAGLAAARVRYQEITDDLLITERAILSAQVTLAQAQIDEATARLDASNAIADAARAAEQDAIEEARTRRLQEVDGGTLFKWRYPEAIAADTYDAAAERERATRVAAADRDRLIDLHAALGQAQAAVDAHRRRHALHVDTES